MSQIKVSYKRHLAKTISYRIISTLVGFIGMWWVTGSAKFGVAFGIAELVYKPIQYYIHERVWYKFVKFGLVTEKEKKPKNVETKPIPKPKTVLDTTPKPKKGKKLSYSKKSI